MSTAIFKTPVAAANDSDTGLAQRYRSIRAMSEALVVPLSLEDQQVQSMPDVSPTKWHLAHVTWFFETFALKPHVPGYAEFRAEFDYLFNSYYEAVGPRHARPERGLLSRPSHDDVMAYRAHVDVAMLDLLDGGTSLDDGLRSTVELGLHHEQQHQELILMDIKHVLSRNPLTPSYAAPRKPAGGGADPVAALRWREFEGGVRRIGHDGSGFAYDNETPRHRVYLEPFQLADRLVTNGEYLEFIQSDGYKRAEFWLSDGWATVNEEGWELPYYWRRHDGEIAEFTLRGERILDLDAPVSHLSFYEAAAYASFAESRLPTEAEWEVAAEEDRVMTGESSANLLEAGWLHPMRCPEGDGGLRQMIGDLWEWTETAYSPYPGFRPGAGAIGEYNGKFMCNQMVLRGGCCATPPGHIRPTYRNFFYPFQRWMFSGLRLARNA